MAPRHPLLKFPAGPARVLACAALVLDSAASGHNGAQLSRADFLHPAPFVETAADGGVTFSYVPEEADQRFRITWQDGDADPTGRFTFYYLDRAYPDAVTAAQIEMLGHPVVDVNGRAASVWASCTCDENLGVTCPPIDFADGGHRWCDNFVDWDTRSVPDGAYFIAAVNDDPPYHVHNLSLTPVRVSHGGSRPPIAIVLRPGGTGLADEGYEIALLAVGEPPLTVDLAFARDDAAHALGPVQAIATGLPVTLASDGAAHASWDTRAIPEGSWFIRASVHDGLGRSAISDSRGGLSVLHLRDAGAPTDLRLSSIQDLGSMMFAAPSPGCACALGPRPLACPPAIDLLPLLAFALILASRLIFRRCARS